MPVPEPGPEPDPPEEEDPCENQPPGNPGYGPLINNGQDASGINALLVRNMLGTGSPPSITNVRGWSPGSGLHRGHLLASRLGGSGALLENLVAMYPRPNTGPMRVLEGGVAAAVAACQIVSYMVTPIYGGGTLPVSSLFLMGVGDRGFVLPATQIINEP